MEQEIDIKIQAAIDAVDASKTLGELRKSIKDLKSLALEAEEGSKAFDTLTTKIGQAEDRLKDLNEVVAMKTGNNVENLAKSFAKIGSYGATSLQAVTGAMGLFGDQSEETMKQLVKLQAAFNFANGIKALVEGFDEVKKAFSVLMTTMKSMMASNPFGLILIAVTAVIGALFLLRNHIKPIGDLFNNIGNIIKNIIQLIKDFSDWLGISNFALEESTKKTIDSAEKQKKAIQDRYEVERKEAEKTKKSIALLTYETEKAINQQTEMQIRAYRKKIMANGSLRDEEKKHYDELEKMNHEYYQNLLKSVDDYISENISKNKQMELELINIKLEADPNNKALLQAKYDAEISLLEDNKEKEIQIIRDARETAKKQNEEAYKDGKKNQEEYNKDLQDINKTSNELISKVREKYNQEEINKTKTKNKTIYEDYKNRNYKILEEEKKFNENKIKVLEIDAKKTEEAFDKTYNNKLLESEIYFKKDFELGRKNFEEKRLEGASLISLFNDTLSKIKSISNESNVELTKSYIESSTSLNNLFKQNKITLENQLSILIENRKKIKDVKSKEYQDSINQEILLNDEIENLIKENNEKQLDLKIKYATFENKLKENNLNYILKLEEDGLNRSSIILMVKNELLKNQREKEDTEITLKYAKEIRDLEKKYNNEKVLLSKQLNDKVISQEEFDTKSIQLENKRGKEISEINKRQQDELINNKLNFENEQKNLISKYSGESIDILDRFNKAQIESTKKKESVLSTNFNKFLNLNRKQFDKYVEETLNQNKDSYIKQINDASNYYDTKLAMVEKGSEEEKRIQKEKEEYIKKLTEEYAEKDKNIKEQANLEWIQTTTNQISQYFSALSTLFSNISSLVDQISEQQIAAAEEVMNKQIEAIDATANAQIAAAERDITDTVALEEAKKNITNNAAAQTLAAKNKYVKEENKLKSKQFKVEKASSIAKATMDGILAVQSALAIAPPMGYILAAISGAAAAVNIGMLASTKPPKELEGADVSGGSFTSPYTGGSGSSGSSSSPNVNAAAFYKLGQGGPNVLSNQSGMDNKVYVVESDIRKTTGRVETIERRASRAL